MCYFWVENLGNLCKLIVCGSQTLRSTQRTQRFPKHRPTLNPVFTVENSADTNPIHTTHSKALFTRVRYRTVPLRSVPKSGTERGCVHTGTEKIKRSVPKQVQKLGGTEK